MTANKGPLYEMCSICQTLQLSNTMVDIYIRDRKGVPFAGRVCRRCVSPQLTGPLGLWIALSGILAGAGITVAFAVSVALPNSASS